MATSPHWRQGRLLVGAFLVVLFVGFVDAATSCYSAKDCHAANAVAQCTMNVCTYTCKPGWSNCDENFDSNGCEVNTDTDVNRCGSCGLQCIPYSPTTINLKCIKGQCAYICKPGLSDCNNWLRDGCESRLPYNNDLRFCGACDTPCLMDLPNAVSKCNRGKCEYTCNPGFGNCDNKWSNGCEVDLNTNINHCKKCNNQCKVTLIGGEATCRIGKCGQQCKTGTVYDRMRKKCVQGY